MGVCDIFIFLYVIEIRKVFFFVRVDLGIPLLFPSIPGGSHIFEDVALVWMNIYMVDECNIYWESSK